MRKSEFLPQLQLRNQNQKKIVVTQEQIDKIIELRALNYTYKQMAPIVSLSQRTIRRIVTEQLYLPNPQTKRTTELAPKILELFATGMNVRRISGTIELDRKAIDRILLENGITPPKAKRTNHLDEQVISLRLGGASSEEIAAMFDIGTTTVGKIYRRNNLPDELLKIKKRSKNPKHRICKDCPENGEQPIENFGQVIHKSGPKKGKSLYRTRCKVCFPIYQRCASKVEYERKKFDVCKRLRTRISGAIWRALKQEGSSKNGASCLDYLPYTIPELKAYLESLFEPWMTWENYGAYKPKTWDDNDQSTWRWSLDHIIPQSLLPYNTMEHPNFQLCWALKNLRPYSAKQNQLDGSTKVRHKAA